MTTHTKIFLGGWLGCTGALLLAIVVARVTPEIMLPFMIFTPVVPAGILARVTCNACEIAYHSQTYRIIAPTITISLCSAYYFIAFLPFLIIPNGIKAKASIATIWMIILGIGGIALAFIGFQLDSPFFTAGSG